MLLRPQRKLWVPANPAIIVPSRRKLPDARRRIVPARASVVLDSNPGTDQGTATPVLLFNYSGLTIGAGLTNSAAFFGVTWAAPVTAPAATWNGVSTTLIHLESSAVLSVALFWKPNPASGNHTFALTWMGSAPVLVAGCSFSGVDQVNGAQHSASNQSGSATSLSQAITTASGNYTMGVCGMDVNSPTFNNTAVFFDNGTTINGFCGALSINSSSSASTTYTATQSVASFAVISGVDIVAAAAAGGVAGVPLGILGFVENEW